MGKRLDAIKLLAAVDLPPSYGTGRRPTLRAYFRLVRDAVTGSRRLFRRPRRG